MLEDIGTHIWERGNELSIWCVFAVVNVISDHMEMANLMASL